MLDRIKRAAEKMGKTQQEVMRLAIEVGLADLQRIDFDVAGAVVDKAKASAAFSQTAHTPGMTTTALLAENPVSYSSKKRAQKAS
jgi:predicted DNA-binding protein